MRSAKICLNCAFYASADLMCRHWHELTRPENQAQDCYKKRDRVHKSPRGQGRPAGGKIKKLDIENNNMTSPETQENSTFKDESSTLKNVLRILHGMVHNYSRAENTSEKACQCLKHGFFHGFCIRENCKAIAAMFAGYGRNIIAAMRICPPFSDGFQYPAFFVSFGHETENEKI